MRERKAVKTPLKTKLINTFSALTCHNRQHKFYLLPPYSQNGTDPSF